MITEDYVSYEVAKLLKEKGFNEICSRYYNSQFNEMRTVGDICMMNWNSISDEYISIPTLQMAMKWLREEYKIFICIVFLEEPDMYGFTIEDTLSKKYLATSKNDGHQTYEEACEAAIMYCLENLIK